MDILKAIATALGLADLWSKYFTKKDDQNTGRKLQQADDLKATAETATHAVQNGEDVRRLSDADLDAELRRDQTGGQ